jgi:uncharacterized protein
MDFYCDALMYFHSGVDNSPLSQRLSRDRTTVEIQIYDDGQDGWILEVVDEFGNSTVWDESFQNDKAALTEVLNTIDTE